MNDLEAAHKHSFKTRDELLVSTACGCFYCERMFSPREVQEWADEGQTAICPYCGIDAVIGDKSGYPIDFAFLRKMKERWFGQNK
jgi:hypothetical protein